MATDEMTTDQTPLERRVQRLEQRLSIERRRSDRLRVTTAGLAGGAAVLIVSMALPWLSESAPKLTAHLYDTPWGTSATGWRMLRWALANPDSSYASETAVAMLLPIAAALSAVFALVTQRPTPGFAAATVAGIAAVGLLFLAVGHATDPSIDGEVSTAPGMFVAGLACLVIVAAGAAQSRSRHLEE
jgi:hypothetical protein